MNDSFNSVSYNIERKKHDRIHTRTHAKLGQMGRPFLLPSQMFLIGGIILAMGQIPTLDDAVGPRFEQGPIVEGLLSSSVAWLKSIE